MKLPTIDVDEGPSLIEGTAHSGIFPCLIHAVAAAQAGVVSFYVEKNPAQTIAQCSQNVGTICDCSTRISAR
jgi:hypothetical protein